MNSSNSQAAHPAGPTVALQKVGMLERVRGFFLGNDVFISYSRSDAADYALGLASELTKQKLTCYLDQWNAPPGVEIPPEIKTALKRSSMLVLVGTKGAAGSIHVGSEVEEFIKTGRPILPVTFGDSLQQATWFPSIRGLALTGEKNEALENGVPSAHIITRVVNAEGFTRRDRRLRRIFLFTALGIAVLVLAGVAVSWKFKSDAQRQQRIGAANLLSSKAFNLQSSRPDLALLLALESYQITNAIDPAVTVDARSGLFELLLRNQKISSFLHGDKEKKETDECVAFSLDGQKVAAGNFDGTVTVWNVHSKKQLPPPAVLNNTTITSLAFSRDGNLLACGRGDGTISIWDESSHQWLKEFGDDVIDSPDTGTSYPISALAFGPDGKTLAIGRCGREDERGKSLGGGDCLGAEILSLDLSSSRPKVSYLPNQHRSAPTSLAYSPDGKTLVSSSNESIHFWDSTVRKVVRQEASQSYVQVRNVTFSQDNVVIAAGLRGDSIIVWDINSGEQLVQPLIGHQGHIKGVAVSPDGVKVASVGDDRNVILWDMGSYGMGQVFRANTETDTVALSPDGRFLATGKDGVLDVWDIAENKPYMASLGGHASVQRSIAFSPDSKMLASPARDSGIILWDVTTKQQISPVLNGNHGLIWRVAFSPDGKTLASANDDGTVSLWNLTSFRESILRLNIKPGEVDGYPPVYHVTFRPDGKLLAIGTQDGSVVFWDMVKSEQVDRLPIAQRGMVMSIAFSPDGNTLAVVISAQPDNDIMLWDVPGRALIRPSLTVNDDYGGGLVFNDDGSQITWVDTKGMVKLWDVASGQLFARIPAGDVGIDQNVASTREGQLATYDNKGVILFWDMNMASWISRACRIANRNLTPDERAEYFLEAQHKDTCKE